MKALLGKPNRARFYAMARGCSRRKTRVLALI
jgi:hypothetical protein